MMIAAESAACFITDTALRQLQTFAVQLHPQLRGQRLLSMQIKKYSITVIWIHWLKRSHTDKQHCNSPCHSTKQNKDCASYLLLLLRNTIFLNLLLKSLVPLATR